MKHCVLTLALIWGLMAGFPAMAREEPDGVETEALLHSDLPLWTDIEKDLWPRHFSDGESFGCMYRLSLGDWRYREAAEAGEEDEEEVPDGWFRFGNYGVIHCYMNFTETFSEDPADLASEGSRFAFMIELGEAAGADGPVELLALQVGARPGSEYLLFSRPRGDEIIRSLAVLQRRCPRGRIRTAGAIDIARTDYCIVSSKRELVALARRMVRLPPLGVLEFVKSDEEAQAKAVE